MAAVQRYYAPEIDGLRFFAALLVLFHHLPRVPYLKAVQDLGWLGVDLFLCISAYLLTRLLRLEIQRTGTINIKNFFIRRALRIWPLYFGFAGVMSLLSVLIFKVSATQSLAWFLSHLSFSANLMTAVKGASAVPFTTHLWTISLEEQAYFLIPFLLLVFIRSSAKAATILLTSAMLVLLLGRLALYLNGASADFILRLPFRADPFILGAATALLDEAARLPRTWVVVCLGMASLLFDALAPGGATIVLYPVSVLCCVSVLVLANRSKNLKAALTLRPFVYLGKISYGIYVYHLLAIGVTTKLFTHHIALIMCGSLTLAVTAAAMSYRVYEAPFLKLKKRFTSVESRPI